MQCKHKCSCGIKYVSHKLKNEKVLYKLFSILHNNNISDMLI